MSIVAMKKLRLIAVKSQQEEILRELMLLGCVEISEPSEEPEERLGSLRRTGAGGAYRARADQSSSLQALRLLDRYAPAKKGLLTPLPAVELSRHHRGHAALDGDGPASGAEGDQDL